MNFTEVEKLKHKLDYYQNKTHSPDFPWSQSAALQILNEAKEYIEKQVNASIEIFEAENSSHVKAKAAIPRRPGINFILKL